jgi:hypothetical protein
MSADSESGRATVLLDDVMACLLGGDPVGSVSLGRSG